MSIIAKAADAVLAYKFIRKLTTPFKDTEAFKLGVIDDKGKVIKKKSERKTPAEKDSMSYMDTLIFNMKKLLSKIGATGKIATLAAALFLLKEHNNSKILDPEHAQMLFEQLLADEEQIKLFEESLDSSEVQSLMEDGVTTGTAGAGVHSDGGKMDMTDPPLYKKSKFAGKTCFDVDPDTFHKCRVGKKKYSRYEKYVGNGPVGEAIREYGRKNPKEPIILKNDKSGTMLYLKYGKQ